MGSKKTKRSHIITAVIFAVAAFFYAYAGYDHFGLFTQKISEEESISGDEYVIVEHVVDGDTFDTSKGERVRMIGIDTPERGEGYYAQAKEHLEKLIYQKNVRLEKDVSETDRYGRLLRHVYIDDLWINKKMIEDGFAIVVTYPPDVAHVEIFHDAQDKAQQHKRGLWLNFTGNDKDQ